MQIIPLLGTALLLTAAAFVAKTAIEKERTQISIIAAQQNETLAGQSARQIDLVPNARDDAFYTAITDRPLFHESRRPIAPETETVAEPAVENIETEAPAPLPQATLPDVRLLGVLSGGTRTAALLSIAGDDPQWQSVGTEISGWTLKEIAADHVVFTEQERAHRVELYQR